MGRRHDLTELLRAQFPDHVQDPEKRVLFQPPATVKLEYPCIIYKLSDMPTNWSNNLPYHWERCYEMTYITRDAQDPMVEKLIALRETKFERYFSADNLHHFVYKIYD